MSEMSRQVNIGARLDPPTARRSTIIKRGRRNALSNKKKKRRLSVTRVPLITERFQLKLKHCVGGGVQHPKVSVIRGRSTVISGHRTVIHIAFPVKNDAHASTALSLIKMRKELLGATNHSRAVLLPNSGSFSNAGATKSGEKALKALQLREAVKVAVLISSWTQSQRLPVNSASLHQTIVDLLKAAGQVVGKNMDPYCWGKGYSLLNSKGDVAAIPEVSKEEQRRVVLSALEKRLNHQGNREMVGFPQKKETIHKRRCDSWQLTEVKRKKIPAALEKHTKSEWPSESRVSSSDEQMSEDSNSTLTDFISDLNRTLTEAYKVESEPKEKMMEESKSELACKEMKVNKKGRRRVVLAAQDERLDGQDNRKIVGLSSKEKPHNRRSKRYGQTEAKREEILGAVETGKESGTPLENQSSSSDEQSSENNSKFKPSAFVSDLERTLITARKIEREPNRQILEEF